MLYFLNLKCVNAILRQVTHNRLYFLLLECSIIDQCIVVASLLGFVAEYLSTDIVEFYGLPTLTSLTESPIYADGIDDAQNVSSV
jgi:hypothetical protein